MRRLGVSVVLLCALSSHAATRDFPFTWSTATLLRGHDEVEVWVSPRFARPTDYSLVENRLVWTHGVRDALESQLSLDVGIEGTETTERVDPRLSSLWRWAPFRSTDVVGLGVLGRVTLGFDVAELELRLLLDKRLGALVLALNGSLAHTLVWKGRPGPATRTEASLGVAYEVGPAALVGLEGRLRSSFHRGTYLGSALYVGPSLTFRFTPRLWLTLGGTAQLTAHLPFGTTGVDGLELQDNERFSVRIALGFAG